MNTECNCIEHRDQKGRLTEVEFFEDCPEHGRGTEEWGWQWVEHDHFVQMVKELEEQYGN